MTQDNAIILFVILILIAGIYMAFEGQKRTYNT